MCINLFFSSFFFLCAFIFFLCLFSFDPFASIPIFCIFPHLIYFYFKINAKLFA